MGFQSVPSFKEGDRVKSTAGWTGTIVKVLKQVRTVYKVRWDKNGEVGIHSPLYLKPLEESMGPFEQQVEEQFTAKDAFSERFSRMYLRYLSETQGISLVEASRRSLSRVLRLLLEPERTAGVITAYRVDLYSDSENKQRNKRLESRFKALKWGYTPIIGGWVQEETGEAIEEESYVVVPRRQDERVNNPAPVFTSQIVQLCLEFEQDGALLKLPGQSKINYVDQHGSVFPVGSKWSFDAAAAAYTKLKGGGQRGRKFKFESAVPRAGSTRQAVYHYFRIKVGDGSV